MPLIFLIMSCSTTTPNLKLLDFSLRFVVIPLNVATIWLTLTNHQENQSYGNLKFSNFHGLKYMVSISALCACYALVAAMASWVIYFSVSKAWLFFVFDQVFAYLMVTSGAAAVEILYLTHNGDKQVTWSEACSSYGKFCHKMELALTLHCLAFFCFSVLAIISGYGAFSIFQPPLSEETHAERT